MSEKHVIDLEGSVDEVARWIWKNLVPKSGSADTVQGEILRAIERLRWEAQENGNINWDEGFEMFIDFIQDTFCSEESFSTETRESIQKDLSRLRTFISPSELEDDSQASQLPYIEDDLYDRLVEHLVSYCKVRPELIPYEAKDGQAR